MLTRPKTKTVRIVVSPYSWKIKRRSRREQSRGREEKNKGILKLNFVRVRFASAFSGVNCRVSLFFSSALDGAQKLGGEVRVGCDEARTCSCWLYQIAKTSLVSHVHQAWRYLEDLHVAAAAESVHKKQIWWKRRVKGKGEKWFLSVGQRERASVARVSQKSHIKGIKPRFRYDFFHSIFIDFLPVDVVVLLLFVPG